MDVLQTFVARLGFRLDAVRAVLVFGLIYARMMPIIAMSPFLGGQLITARIKILLSMLLTIVITPYFYINAGEIPVSYAIIFFFMKEVFIGMVIGFYVSLIYYAIQGAGFVIDQARGQTQGASFDPFLSAQVSNIGEYLNLLSIVLFFVINGHLIFINEISSSYLIVPIDSFPQFQFSHIMTVLKFSSGFFVIALRLSVPVLLVILSVDIFMGIVNKLAASVNVFFISMPLKAFAGILVFLLALPLYFGEIKSILSSIVEYIKHFLGLL